MTNTELETCPGPSEAPYRVAEDQVWPHRWVPVVLMGIPGDRADRPPENSAGHARVLEACPTCRQWRQVDYTRIPSPPSVDG